MKIGELSRASGVAASRIRFYETAGLLAPSGRTPAGYRLYGDDALQALQIINYAQLGGFTLAEIKSLLPHPDSPKWNHDDLLKALHSKVAAIEELQERLARSQRQLRVVIADIENKPDDLACIDNADRVLNHLNESLAEVTRA